MEHVHRAIGEVLIQERGAELPLSGWVFVCEGGCWFLGKVQTQCDPIGKPVHPYLEPAYCYQTAPVIGLNEQNQKEEQGVVRQIRPILGYAEIRRKDLRQGTPAIEVESLSPSNRRELADLVADYETKLLEANQKAQLKVSV